MTQIQSYSDEKLISYVEKHAKDLPMVSDRWVACRKELERRGYIFWVYTGKVQKSTILLGMEEIRRRLNQ